LFVAACNALDFRAGTQGYLTGVFLGLPQSLLSSVVHFVDLIMIAFFQIFNNSQFIRHPTIFEMMTVLLRETLKNSEMYISTLA
jgi:hypothetical protein